ncbi:MAG: GAF domain-containing sensor histidine kinase [Nitriliruptorales bacterium]
MSGSPAAGDGLADGATPSAAALAAAPYSLEELERRRWRLWAIAGFFLLAVSAVVVLAFTDTPLSELVPDTPGLRWAFLGLSVAFILYVIDQERSLRTLTRAVVDRDVLTASLESRVDDLETLARVGRLVNSVLTVDEVTAIVLDAAFALSRATKGSVLLREDEDLRVVVSEGADGAPVGAIEQLGKGVAGEVGAALTARLLVDGVDGGHGPQRGSAIVAPLASDGDLQGVLCLARGHDSPAFSALDLRSVELFAEQAATAIANARRYEEERATARRLADVLELRSEFVATMVHDLKSPLTAIMGFAKILRQHWERLDSEKRVEAFDSIQDQAERLFRMVEEVLRSTSIEAGAELHREPVDVHPLLEQLVEEVRGAAVGREGGSRQLRLDVVGPATVYGDPEALRHIFGNLLENAVKYSPAGSPIEVAVDGGTTEVIVHVKDRGRGIPPEDLAEIFERFRQATGTRKSGVGLGLYIVKTLVGAHGGEVEVQSEPGVGTAFSVTLPVRPDAEDPVSPTSDAADRLVV